jgi:hypothetical protein
MRKINGLALEEVDEVGFAGRGKGFTGSLINAGCKAFFARRGMRLNEGSWRKGKRSAPVLPQEERE